MKTKKLPNNYNLLPIERELVIQTDEESKILHITARTKSGITYCLNNPDFLESQRDTQVADGIEQVVGITGLLPVGYLTLGQNKRKSNNICDIFSRKRRKGSLKSN